jgi:pimeloyl-ACP methyl ester carboxylesterase
MAKQKQKRSYRRTRLKWFFAACLLSVAALAALVYLRPVATMTLVQRGLLRLGGVESKFAQIGPHRIHYLIGGDGPILVLLHGHPSRALEWGPIIRELAAKHQVIAIDFLGYGDSDAPDVAYNIETQVSVVVGLLGLLNIRQADVLGFSMGGWVALKVAADHPYRVRLLVLVDCGGLTFPTTLTADRFVPTTLPEFRALEKLHSESRLPDFVARDLLRVLQERSWALRRMGASLLSFREVLDGRLSSIKVGAAALTHLRTHRLLHLLLLRSFGLLRRLV